MAVPRQDVVERSGTDVQCGEHLLHRRTVGRLRLEGVGAAGPGKKERIGGSGEVRVKQQPRISDFEEPGRNRHPREANARRGLRCGLGRETDQHHDDGSDSTCTQQSHRCLLQISGGIMPCARSSESSAPGNQHRDETLDQILTSGRLASECTMAREALRAAEVIYSLAPLTFNLGNNSNAKAYCSGDRLGGSPAQFRRSHLETMPVDRCVFFWECPDFHVVNRPKVGRRQLLQSFVLVQYPNVGVSDHRWSSWRGWIPLVIRVLPSPYGSPTGNCVIADSFDTSANAPTLIAFACRPGS